MRAACSVEDVLLHPMHWTEALPEALRRTGVEELLKPCGLEFRSYGTARMMAQSANEVREVIDTVGPPVGAREDLALLECLPVRASARLESAGLLLCKVDRSSVSRSMGALRRARRSVYAIWPELSFSIGCLVRSIHLLEAPSPEVDCSYSRPDLPFSVFVSVPDCGAQARIERLTEALVHEAMHLQLSLIERLVPLISSNRTNAVAFSPWRDRARPVRGVLHALYVFAVLQRLWRCAIRKTPSGLDRGFAEARVRAIHEEVGKARHLAGSPGLTREGRQLVQQLLAPGGASADDGPGL